MQTFGHIHSKGGRLYGTPYGSPEFGAGNAPSVAWDNNLVTLYHSLSSANGLYLGIDLGYALIVKRLRLYLHRSDSVTRILNCVFEGSNTSQTTGFTVLKTFTAGSVIGWNDYPITNTTAYRYYRIRRTTANFFELAEFELYAQ